MTTEQQIKDLSKLEDLSDRLEAAARLSDGQIVEIGAGEGINTLRFLKIADERNTVTIVIDPFEQIEGADESYFRPYSLENFLKTTEKYFKHLYLVQLPSQAPRVKDEIKPLGKIGFVFIDGLQDKDSVMYDIQLAASLDAEIICIDDYNRLTESSQVPVAVDWFRQRLINYEFMYNGQREVYFIRK
jgi:predicted O-methyltransferase YrrM